MLLTMGSEVYGTGRNRYRVGGFIRRGAFGELYKIISEDDGQAYALKTAPTGHHQGEAPDMLINEARMAPLVDHPNVIRVYYFHDGRAHPGLPLYLILDYADGGSLRDLLDLRRSTVAQFDIDYLYNMLSQLARGMMAVNEVLIHGDIKPDNILINGGMPKIADFGLSRMIGTTSRAAGGYLQHERYMSPEAWQHRISTIQMDIYSMGIVFYELATLRHPYDVSFGGEPIASWRDVHLHARVVSPETVNPSLPPVIAQVISRMLAKAPEDRSVAWGEIVDCLKPGWEKYSNI